MKCAATSQDAPASGVSAGPLHPDTLARRGLCGRAKSIADGPKPDGVPGIIQSRANRLTHSNAVQKARFLTLHQTLAKGV